MRRWTLVLTLALTIVPPALSQEPAEPAWKKASGGFGAVLLVTNDAPGFFATRHESPPVDYLSRIQTTSKAQRGETVVAVVIFYGCAVDDAGNCRSSMKLQLRRPDGSIYGGFEDLELWDGPAPPEGRWEASTANLGLEVEPDDPLGTYTFEAVLRDHVARRVLKLSQTVEVVSGAR
jgi:hypothetical protein